MRKTLRNTSACAILGLVVACGSSGGGGGGNTSAFQAALQGTWEGCVPTSLTESTSVTFVITGLNFTVTPVSFGTPDCSGSPTALPQQSGTLTIGSAETVQLNMQSVTAYQVDQTITSPAIGTTYTLAYVDTTASPNLLYQGATIPPNDGSTPAKRPTVLSPLPFQKQ